MMFDCIYYIGILACALQGAEKAAAKAKFFVFAIVYISSMGGGLLRDLVVFRTTPVAFTLECIPEAILCVLAIHVFNRMKYHPLLSILVEICDAAGVGCFIVIGVDRAISCGVNRYLVLLSGLLTALGGGITSSLICGVNIKKIISKGNQYRLIVAIGDLAYTLGCHRETLLAFVFIAVILSNKHMRSLIEGKVSAPTFASCYITVSYNAIIASISMYIVRNTPVTCQEGVFALRNVIKDFLRYRRNTCVLFHHIRQLAA